MALSRAALSTRRCGASILSSSRHALVHPLRRAQRSQASRVCSASSSSTSAVIAVDGPAAAGKGTLARKIAQLFKFAHLDTGLLYRAVGWHALQQGVPLGDEAALESICTRLTPEDLANTNLRTDTAAQAASTVARLPRVRAALLTYQQNFAASPPGGAPGAVLDGRDVGTRICPHAPVKLYVTASAEVRAARRANEFGTGTSYEQVLQDIISRDERDRLQSAPAADAVTLDTSNLNAEQALQAALDIVSRRLPQLVTH